MPDTQKTTKGVREAPTATEMELRYEETGEVRPPRAGEWFRTSRGGEERARFDFSVSPLPILKEIFQPKAEPRYTVELTTEGWQIKDNKRDRILAGFCASREEAREEVDHFNQIDAAKKATR